MITRIGIGALAALLTSSAAFAFNPEEHKLAGDLGSAQAGAELAKLKLLPASRALIRIRTGGADAPEVRLVDSANVPKVNGKPDPRFKGFFPREAKHKPQSPILVWVGKADGKGEGGWFSIGDLVSLYGDFRRVITCDDNAKNDTCALADKLADFNKARRTALRDLAQGWTFWDGEKWTKFSTAAVTNNGVYGGRDDQAAWADEFFRIAKGNHWHFGETAVRWYAAMHRQAFLMMSESAKAKAAHKQAEADQLMWKAFHYEAHALHSLTDLFAVGHIMVDRWNTTVETLRATKEFHAAGNFNDWQERVFKSGIGQQTGVSAFTNFGPFEPVAKASRNQMETLTGISSLTRHGFWESQFHDSFNKFGAMVQNLKQMKLAGAHFAYPHAELGGAFRAFGDGEMLKYGKKSGARYNPVQAEWTAAAVHDSIMSLFTEYQKLLAAHPAKTAEELSKEPALYEALADIPIQMRNVCYNDITLKGNCFAPQKKTGPAPFKYVYYAPVVAGVLHLQAPDLKTAGRLPRCTGASASVMGKNSGVFTEACESKYDGATSQTERAAGKAGKEVDEPGDKPKDAATVMREEQAMEKAEAANLAANKAKKK